MNGWIYCGVIIYNLHSVFIQVFHSVTTLVTLVTLLFYITEDLSGFGVLIWVISDSQRAQSAALVKESCFHSTCVKLKSRTQVDIELDTSDISRIWFLFFFPKS